MLFICGGAFAGLDKVIGKRVGYKGLGFGADVKSRREQDPGEIFEKTLPEDLINYGLIPEFIGRLPVVTAVHSLREPQLISILTEPKNALVKQFQRFFAFDNIDLVFADDALAAIADRAIERETGARGLRSIMEETLLDVQFELPVPQGRHEVRRHQGDDREGHQPDARHRSRQGRARRRQAHRPVAGRADARVGLPPRLPRIAILRAQRRTLRKKPLAKRSRSCATPRRAGRCGSKRPPREERPFADRTASPGSVNLGGRRRGLGLLADLDLLAFALDALALLLGLAGRSSLRDSPVALDRGDETARLQNRHGRSSS